MWGLKVTLDAPYFTSFRHPTTTSLILSYSIPPYTTIRGLIANALGLPRDYFEIQDWFKIGIKLVKSNKNRELAKILKLKGSGKRYTRVFPSAPMFREFIAEPQYQIFLVGNKEIIEKIHSALLMPYRPLYLGISDDLIDLIVEKPSKVKDVQSDETWTIVEGLHAGCIVERIPYKFNKRGKNIDLEYKIVSIPTKEPIKDKLNLVGFEGGEKVWVT